MDCRICSTEVKPYLSKNGFDVFLCPACGFGQADVTPEQIVDFYDQSYFEGEKALFAQAERVPVPPTHRFWIEQQLAAIRSGPGLKVLEIGPGLGGPLASYFQQSRPDVQYTAVEVSEYATERLRSRGLDVHCGRIADPAIMDRFRGQFDLVFGTEVIEHDLEPHAFIGGVGQVLKPGGRAAFTTGNIQGWMARRNGASWYYMAPPAHVSFYSPDSAKQLFLSEGFRSPRVTRYGFRHIEIKQKTHLPGLLLLTHLANVSTGMTISAFRK